MLESKCSVSETVFCAVTNDGCVIPPHVVPSGLKMATTEFMTIMENVLIPFSRQRYDLDDVTLVQDSAPVHT